MFSEFINFVRDIYGTTKKISLHEPKFIGNEKKYLNQCIDTNFVSSIGKFVDKFEKKIAKYTGVKHAIATNNGTSALHISLILAGVEQDDEVITQPLNFVSSCNAISYCKARPIFIDVDRATMGMSPSALRSFLEKNTIIVNKKCINKKTKKIIKACIPMHSYGHPCHIDEIKKLLKKYYIFLIEDAAESLGSTYKDKHTGTFGHLGTLSFNGNKIITAGGGGCILTNDKVLAKKAKHLTTTSKVPHKWEFNHDMVGFNYRMPNINAALGCAHLEALPEAIEKKRQLVNLYQIAFQGVKGVKVFTEPTFAKSNYWLNVLLLDDEFSQERDSLLDLLNARGIMVRPLWTLMHELEIYKHCPKMDDLLVAQSLSRRLINVPSSPHLVV